MSDVPLGSSQACPACESPVSLVRWKLWRGEWLASFLSLWKSLSGVWLFATLWSNSPWNSPGQNTRVDSHALFQGIFPTPGSNLDLPYCRWILYQLSHKGSPRILGWMAYPFSSRSSWPRDWTGVSCIAGGFFTNWAIRERLSYQT